MFCRNKGNHTVVRGDVGMYLGGRDSLYLVFYVLG